MLQVWCRTAVRADAVPNGGKRAVGPPSPTAKAVWLIDDIPWHDRPFASYGFSYGRPATPSSRGRTIRTAFRPRTPAATGV